MASNQSHGSGSADIQESSTTPTPEVIAMANALKEEGNECVKASKFEEAIQKYAQAINMNPDPVFFCNRAAAYCRLEQFDLAIEDCRTALALDEKYAKAYGRMGLALSGQNRYDDAVDAYKKALELDPNNESYKSNLAIAEEKARETNQRFQNNPGANPFGGLSGLFGGGAPDLSALMNDPQMMNASMQMMNDPNMQNLMSSMMEQFMGGSSGGAAGENFADLLAAGQSMAQQMQQANPELVDQLRHQFSGSETQESGSAYIHGSSTTPSSEDIAKANTLKEEGNECVKASKFDEAIQKYTQAININPDPIFFCNRSAAYCRLEQYDLAIEDCRTALALDEKYAKAYGRMGLALSFQNRFEEAIEAYKKALELDPNNESYKSNLAIAEEKVREAQFQNNTGANPLGGLNGLLGGAPGGVPDLSALMNNPQMMNAAMQMMNDPNMQNLMSSMMEQFMGGSSGGAGPAGGNFADLLAAGQSIAQQMQQSNPELVEQLRQQVADSSTNDANQDPNDSNNGQQNPDN